MSLQVLAGRGDRGRVDFGHAVQARTEDHGRRQLERSLRVFGSLEVRDPHGTVRRRATDRAVTLGDDSARWAAQCCFRMCVVAVHPESEAVVGDPGNAVGGAQLAQYGLARIVLPVDRAIGLAHERTKATASHCQGRLGGRCHPPLDSLERVAQRTDSRLGDFVAVQAPLADGTHTELGTGPDVPGIHFGIGLQYRDAPARFAFLHCPVERRRTAVADDPRMHDETAHARPYILRNGALEKGGDHDIGRKPMHRIYRHRIIHIEFQGDIVSPLGELDPEPLRQAVERVREQQDAHESLSRCAATARR